MRQGSLRDLAREYCALARPITEGAAETVNGRVNLHATQHHFEGHHRKGAVGLHARKHEVRTASIALSTATARSENGTRWTRPAFIRSAGTVQTRASRSISCHRAPSTSPERAATRIANSSAA